MPNCFTLTRKGMSHPEKLPLIDDALCAHLGVTPDPTRYHQEWVDIEGFGFAMGKTMDEIRAIDPSPEREPIRQFLEQNYTVDAWAEIGRR